MKKNNNKYNPIIKTIIILIFSSCFQNVMAESVASQERRMINKSNEDAFYNRQSQQQSSQGGGGFLGALMMQGFGIYHQQKQEKRAELSTFRPPYETKHSRAKQLLSGYTLIFDNDTPIWFAADGSAASKNKNDPSYAFKWFVKGDEVCMGPDKENTTCMSFVFNKKRVGLKTNTGEVIYTFQLIGADIRNLSKNN